VFFVNDGVVAYLNGTEIYRNNMPAGPINPNHWPERMLPVLRNDIFSDHAQYGLINGTNVLAVELHQAAPDSIDLSFDLELDAANVITLKAGPYLQSGTTTNVE